MNDGYHGAMRLHQHQNARTIVAKQDLLTHVYWIGGGSCAGKSTIGRRIAAEHGMQLYETDLVMADHARRVTAVEAPLLHDFLAMDMDTRWVSRTPKKMLETFHWFRGEGFHLIVDDLLRLPRAPGIIVEGFRLLPALVKPLLGPSTQAVWLLPTPEFREAVVDARGGRAWGFLAKTAHPERARTNLLERDRLFTGILTKETARLALPALTVDGTITEDDLAKRVTAALGLR